MTGVIHGACHCGNLRYELHTATRLQDITARACDCSFCRLHGARTWSDPHGSAILRVADPEHLQRYRFGTGVTEFLICRTCGAYAGATVTDHGETFATLNLQLTGTEIPAEPVHYGKEARSERRARRKGLWTPTRILAGPHQDNA